MMASAHVCYGNYLPAMGITFTLHTHGDICYKNYFFFVIIDVQFLKQFSLQVIILKERNTFTFFLVEK